MYRWKTKQKIFCRKSTKLFDPIFLNEHPCYCFWISQIRTITDEEMSNKIATLQNPWIGKALEMTENKWDEEISKCEKTYIGESRQLHL